VESIIITYIYSLLLFSLVLSAGFDVIIRRIPNIVIFPSVLLLLLGHICLAKVGGLVFGLVGMILGFFVLWLPYLFGGMGAGDVKLMMTVGAALGWRHTLLSCIFIAICGGMLAVFFMVKRGVLKKTFAKIGATLLLLAGHGDGSLLKYKKEEIVQEGIPFGVAICGGVLLFFAYMVYAGNGAELLNPYPIK
jgi:prepilin peptidase CpaA